jgi:hypothetical protein
MKVSRFDPILADWGEPDMEENKTGCYVSYWDYNKLLEKYNKLKKVNKELKTFIKDEIS